MAALTVVFDLDGTLVDTAPDLIETLNVVFAREGLPPVDYAAARNMIGGGARRMIESGLKHEGRAPSGGDVDRMFADFIAYYAAHIADRSQPFPGLDAALDRLAAAAAALRSAPTSSKDCRGCCSMRSASPGALPRSAARTHSGFKSPTRRSCGGPSGRPAARLNGRSWWGTPAPISPPRAPPAFRSWRSISATARRPFRDLGPDRLISHFDDLAAAVLELAQPLP